VLRGPKTFVLVLLLYSNGCHLFQLIIAVRIDRDPKVRAAARRDQVPLVSGVRSVLALAE